MEDNCPACRGTGYSIRTGDDGVSVAAPCSCAQAERGERLLRAARIPRRYEHCTLDSYESHDPSHSVARQISQDWVERWPLVEHGLLFVGQPGTGKTHLAVGIARQLAAEKGAHVLFYEQRELLKDLQSTFDSGAARTESDILRPILCAQVVVLDDLGAGRTTPWARDVMHDVIAHRYNERLPMILTSNLPPGEEDVGGRGAATVADSLSLRDRLGDALMSRMYEMCRIVTLAGRDFRRGVLHARIHF